MAARYTALLALAAPVLSENNGRAVTPPMGASQGRHRVRGALTPFAGWRDWNQYQGNINQELMELAFHGLADKSRSVGGTPMSLAEVGYVRPEQLLALALPPWLLRRRPAADPRRPAAARRTMPASTTSGRSAVSTARTATRTTTPTARPSWTRPSSRA